jgi:outer membrane protein assembly factor BamB
LKWKFATGAWVDSSPGMATDGTVYFGSWDRNFYALNPDGSLKWKFATGGVVDSSPAIAADGTVYFGSHDRKFYALDPAGKVRWTFLTRAEIPSSPAIGKDGDVYFSSTDGFLYRLTAGGKEVWRCLVESAGAGSPVLAENGNIVLTVPYKFLSVSPAGAVVASSALGDWLDLTPAATRDALVFAHLGRQFWVQPDAGGELWHFDLNGEPVSSPVLGNHGEVYFCVSRGVMALQPPALLMQPSTSSWPMFRAESRHTGRVRTAEPGRQP